MEHVTREFEGRPERAETIRSAVDARRKKLLELTPPAPPAGEGVQ